MKRLHIIAAMALGYALGTARRTSSQLTRIERKLETMANEQEQQLDTALSEMKEAVTQAADRVIRKLEAKDIDLTDEIADVNAIKDAVAGIAPDAAPASTEQPIEATAPTEVAAPAEESTETSDLTSES